MSASPSPALDAALPAGDIVGLLAEGDRLRVVAALVLGATSAADVARVAGVDARRGGRALARLVDGGLVESDGHGYRLLEEEIRLSARAAAAAGAPAVDEHEGVAPEAARVLRAFVREGRLLSISAVRSKRLVVLDLLAQAFEPGLRYPEAAVNLMLGMWHPDAAALRRYLVDEGILARADGIYWRVGGTVSLDEAALDGQAES